MQEKGGCARFHAGIDAEHRFAVPRPLLFSYCADSPFIEVRRQGQQRRITVRRGTETMNLSVEELRPKYLEISYTADGNKTSAVIRLDLAPTLSTTVLEIGEKYVFAHRRKRPFLAFLGKRRLCDFSMNVERKSDHLCRNKRPRE